MIIRKLAFYYVPSPTARSVRSFVTHTATEAQRVAALHNIPHTYTDLRQLLARDDIQAVDVCLQLQEMLLQTDGDAIYLLPCWDTNVDVTFRLHAPGNTVVECTYQAGEIVSLHVTPAERQRDLILPAQSSNVTGQIASR